jgi:hypothetical protein
MFSAQVSFFLAALLSLASSPVFSEDCIYGNCSEGMSIKKIDGGSIFLGAYKDGALTGPGRFIDQDGDQCTGEWLNGRMSGETFCRYTNGSVFVGNFVSGRKNGGGIHFAAGGAVLREGIYESGKLALSMATKYSDNADLYSNTLDSKFNDCLIGDCVEDLGIKLGFGNVLQGKLRNSQRHAEKLKPKPLQTDQKLQPQKLRKKESITKSAAEKQSQDLSGSKASSGIVSMTPEKIVPKRTLSEAEAGIPVQYRNNDRQEHDDMGLWIFIALSVPLIGWLLKIYFFEIKN